MQFRFISVEAPVAEFTLQNAKPSRRCTTFSRSKIYIQLSYLMNCQNWNSNVLANCNRGKNLQYTLCANERTTVYKFPINQQIIEFICAIRGCSAFCLWSIWFVVFVNGISISICWCLSSTNFQYFDSLILQSFYE